MFVVTAAVLVMGPEAQALLKDDPQKVLPTLVMTKMPVMLQVAFFGALLSAIMSTASATLLAPSTAFVENILRNIRPGMSDAATLRAMRLSVLTLSAVVLSYAITMQGTSIYELVSGAYQVPLVGAFVPLVFGLYWKRATTQGALASIVLGLGTWLVFIATPALSEAFPQQLAGLLAALGGHDPRARCCRSSLRTTRATCTISRAARQPEGGTGRARGRGEGLNRALRL